ncbi:MAG: serine hydroxymethyltransferase [Roseibium sp.]|nr:serine hydroxymethyltransferase [Roseibium sp.]
MSRLAGRPGHIYLELYPVGQQIKVSAIDAATGLEVSIFGPTSASQEDLKRLAVRKLKHRLGQAVRTDDVRNDPSYY